jgi:hypothetical protein
MSAFPDPGITTVIVGMVTVSLTVTVAQMESPGNVDSEATANTFKKLNASTKRRIPIDYICTLLNSIFLMLDVIDPTIDAKMMMMACFFLLWNLDFKQVSQNHAG